jgi:isopentenyl-diphosphate delta-isomerase
MQAAILLDMDEMIDIVDPEGTVLYSVAKSEAHAKGLLHRTVVAEVRNSKGEWLLVKQSPDKQDAGQYVVPVGGHVAAGETDTEALVREVFEEIGLKDFSHELVGKCIFERHVIGRHENHYFVIFRITSDEDLVLNHESVEYVTFSEDELKQHLLEAPHQFGNAFFALLEQFYPHMLPAKR